MDPLYWSLLLLIASLSILVYVAYQRLFSPLAGIPGPFAASLSRLWLTFAIRKGGMHERLPALHRQYGPLVRVAPNEVHVSKYLEDLTLADTNRSISDPAVARKIYSMLFLRLHRCRRWLITCSGWIWLQQVVLVPSLARSPQI